MDVIRFSYRSRLCPDTISVYAPKNLIMVQGDFPFTFLSWERKKMKKILLVIMFSFFCSFFSSFLYAQNKLKLAVLYFKDTSLNGNYANFVEGLPDILMTGLSQSQQITIVERVQINEAIRNFKIERSGYIDDSTAVKVGKWLGADAIVIGNFMSIGQDVRIDARVINISTGVLMKATRIQGKSDDLFNLVDSLSEKIIETLTGETIKLKLPPQVIVDKEFRIQLPTRQSLFDTKMYFDDIGIEKIFYYKSDYDDSWLSIERHLKFAGAGNEDSQGHTNWMIITIYGIELIMRCNNGTLTIMSFDYRKGVKYPDSICGGFLVNVELIDFKMDGMIWHLVDHLYHEDHVKEIVFKLSVKRTDN
jgi:TolB-like protein